MKSKYEILVNILDKIRAEAPTTAKKYHEVSEDGRNNARALALIHLYMKSKFGLMTFDERIKFVTDDKGDGGIDAYYFSNSDKTLYVIQSKFRATEDNFESKSISSDELAAVDLARIEKGETHGENGVEYNGKIKNFQRIIKETENFERWNCKVIILANVQKLSDESIKRLVGGFKFEVFDHERVYKEIVLPICSGQYFDAEKISLEIEIGEGQKTEFSQIIGTQYGEFQIRLIFIPAMEIAKNVVKYKNSLMKYNPRNFLSFKKNSVNDSIRESITSRSDNFFAILNNGITFIAKTDSFTDRTGVRRMGRLTITNPQIINGGQTAYALGTIYDDEKSRVHLENKSVLAKIITPIDDQLTVPSEFIETVSLANNRQSKIVEADQRSNSNKLISLQEYFFDNHHLFFERKRGEFYEGLELKYLEKSAIINRVELLKAAVAYKGNPAKSRTSQDTLFEEDSFDEIIDSMTTEELALAYLLRKRIKESPEFIGVSPFAVISIFGTFVDAEKLNSTSINVITEFTPNMKQHWDKFIEWAKIQPHNSSYLVGDVLHDNYYKGSTIGSDLSEFHKEYEIELPYK